MRKNILIQQINQGLSTWKMATLNNTTQYNIRYWLKKYNLKTQRIVNKLNNNRKCLTCNKVQHQDNFYKKGKKYISHCKICYQKKYNEIRRKKKQMSIKYLGGKCVKCGYNKCNAALDFHHINPRIKDINISKIMSEDFTKIKAELDKCILLCANCHREEHYK